MARAKRYMMDTPAHKKSLAYRAHKSLGLCARCSNPPVTGKACCQVCIDTMAARKQQAVDEGRCIDCWTVQALPGKRYCETHDLAHQQRRRERYMGRYWRHLCTRCGKHRSRSSHAMCVGCRKTEKARLRRRRAVPDVSATPYGAAVPDVSGTTLVCAVPDVSGTTLVCAVPDVSVKKAHDHDGQNL